MDIWKFYDITHKMHGMLNPTDEAKIRQLVDKIPLKPGDPVVDIAAGKGEFLIRLAEAYSVNGIGVDISPYFIDEATKRLADRVPDADVSFIQMDGAEFVSEKPRKFKLASCLGASWIFKGHEGTLKAMIEMVDDGWIVVGEPYWRREPSPEYLAESGNCKEDFGTHAMNVTIGEKLGLNLVYTIVSSEDDWDVYEGLQWYAADTYARSNADDPDVAELTERIAKQKTAYLKWGRETLSWAIYIFRTA